ncbi:MAG: DinB family protein [Dehalococcoidia bacterium]
MATATPISKVDLIARARAQWAETEASIAAVAKGNFDARPSAEEWSAAEIYRHIIDTVHKAPETIEQLVHGQPPAALSPGDPQGLVDFASLNAKMLPIELNTAHGIVWMALQKLAEADLEKSFEAAGRTFTLGEFLNTILVAHEAHHIEQAKKAAGLR